MTLHNIIYSHHPYISEQIYNMRSIAVFAIVNALERNINVNKARAYQQEPTSKRQCQQSKSLST